MKILLSSLILIVACSIAVARPRPTPKPTPAPTAKAKQELVCRTKQQDLELRDWINGIMTEAAKAKAETSAALKSNADTKAKLDVSIQDGKNLANECAADKKCAQAPLSCWFHRLMKHLFWIAGAAVLLIIGLMIASFFFPALGPILSFFVSIWKWLLGLLGKFKWPTLPKPPAPPPVP